MNSESVTIATVTYAGSFVDMIDFLCQIQPAIEHYQGVCELLIINNSGVLAAEATELSVRESNIREICATRVLSSPENNIGIARNIAVEQASNDLLIFLDDDEFPVPTWITDLTAASSDHDAQMVSGPTYPLFLFDTPKWVETVDLHNTAGRKTGQILDKSGAGNLLIRRSSIVGDTFSEVYGRSGGEDTEFVHRQVQNGLKLVWCEEAAAFEYMPKEKSTARYFIKRFVIQGQLHRKVMIEIGAIKNRFVFVLKSLTMILLSLVLAPILVMTSSRFAGRWVKRGFANVGHLTSFSNKLYSSDSGSDK